MKKSKKLPSTQWQEQQFEQASIDFIEKEIKHDLETILNNPQNQKETK